MELTPRKKAVLKAIIKAHIKTGEPIGSKNLINFLENPPSSATLRNEMSELCELGFLTQPHISAGRIPTSVGYKFYIDSLMTEKEPDIKITASIDSALTGLYCEPEEILATAARALSNLTGLPAFACFVSEGAPTIKKIELLPIGKSSVMTVIVTKDGRTKSRVFRKNITENELQSFKALANEKIKNKSVNELNIPYAQSIIAAAGTDGFELMPLISSVFELASSITKASVNLSGENLIYNIYSDKGEAISLIKTIKNTDILIPLLQNSNPDSHVIFGEQTGIYELGGANIIFDSFESKDKYRAFVGVIGPDRMSYEEIIPATKHIAERLSKIMREAQNDMED